MNLMINDEDLKARLFRGENINFDIFEDTSVLDYFWSLLNHYQNVHNTDKIREIIAVE